MAISVRFAQPSFARMRPTWLSTVRSESTSRSAICRFVRAAATPDDELGRRPFRAVRPRPLDGRRDPDRAGNRSARDRDRARRRAPRRVAAGARDGVPRSAGGRHPGTAVPHRLHGPDRHRRLAERRRP
ncbi:MAG: hypothetical protein AVDCRST_MAG57-52 [uncultured Blastococcus sp.]|uniref:Uncharacterized protein n=1 Tax=uncultured Blastococcus sp. TaxID=217144 RepID=A0A6J4H147_9ACTN|nr:MAG: hypothetical protein AVDCRST_MAG57-52 [uncultured Blastococcus sp.]